MPPATIKRTDDQATARAMYAAYQRRAEDWRRDHLGASILGHKCDRYLWLAFRWALAPKHDGKQLRLFERGNRAESWLIEDLRAAGMTVDDRDEDTGEQFRMRWGHIGGGIDGVVTGLLELPKEPHLLECKTHSSNSFARLKEKGVKGAKPEHYAQMQVYMHGIGLWHAFYLAVCKDNDELYTERIVYDQTFAEELIDRGQQIIALPKPPERMAKDFPPCIYVSKDGTTWPCQFRDLCHGEAVVERNCRTCVESTPQHDGTWTCEQECSDITANPRAPKCKTHLPIPETMTASVSSVDETARTMTLQFPSGPVVEFRGGDL